MFSAKLLHQRIDDRRCLSVEDNTLGGKWPGNVAGSDASLPPSRESSRHQEDREG